MTILMMAGVGRGVGVSPTGSFLGFQLGSSFKLEVLNNQPCSPVPSCNERWPWRLAVGMNFLDGGMVGCAVSFIWRCLKQLFCFFFRFRWLMMMNSKIILMKPSPKWKALIKLLLGMKMMMVW